MAEYVYENLQSIKGATNPCPRERIVRCRDCKHYYEAENYHPKGNYVMRCCNYFDTYNDEVEPDGFCKWGERKEQWRNGLLSLGQGN